ncbi:Dipeptidase 2 [Collichthys lucidus]|uniref:Dipeptidase n=1 Tax=Collichthys lucidus TaxID=240159 RepID=A0A4U5U6C8_COLLU|nr:Dipeptidase 2 [Collichthys lucidus]
MVNKLLFSDLAGNHNDLALQLRILHNNQLSQIDLHNVSKVATDITRLQAGHVQAQEKDAVRLTLEQIDVVRRMCTEYQDFEIVTSSKELRSSEMRNKTACLISVEGGHSIDSSLPALRMFYQLGAVVDEMNRLGMIVDLSHTSWGTAWAVLKHSKAPVIFSHSSSYSVCNNSRNVPDRLLHELKKNQGLIMVNLHSNFISCSNEANISHVADHFDYIKKIIGAESVGIGGDFDGAVRFPQGLEDVSKYPALIQELLQRNWTENELANVLRRNFLRVFKEVEKVRDQLNLNKPSEVQIPHWEVQNPCRLVLKRPELRQQKSSSSRAQHGPKDWAVYGKLSIMSRKAAIGLFDPGHHSVEIDWHILFPIKAKRLILPRTSRSTRDLM